MTVWNYRRVLIADIITEASIVFGVPEEIIKGKSRHRASTDPRFACCYLAKELTALSYPQIGRAIGDRDHSTTISARKGAMIRLERNPEYRAYVDAVRIRLLSSREREVQRRRDALAVARERERLEQLATEREALAEAEQARINTVPTLVGEMDELSGAVSAYIANGGSFVEVRA